jgi:hypothetical protein
MLRYITIIIVGYFLAGCVVNRQAPVEAPSDSAQNQPAPQKETSVPAQKETEPPVVEATPLIIPEPSPTPETLIIITDPRELLPLPDELPQEGGYYQPDESYTKYKSNDSVIEAKGEAEGTAYVTETGRLTGWVATFKRSSSEAQVPEYVHIGIYQFLRPEGASLSLTKFGLHVTQPDLFENLDTSCTFGPVCVDYSYVSNTANGIVSLTRDLFFTYNNLVILVEVYGHEIDIRDDFVAEIAGVVKDKINAIAEYGPASSFE